MLGELPGHVPRLKERLLRLSLILGLAGAVFGLAACSDSGLSAPPGVTALGEVTPPGGARHRSGRRSRDALQRADGQWYGGICGSLLGDTAGPLVPMSCTWAADSSTLTCTPGEPLHSRTRYTIHVGSGMRNANGHSPLRDPIGASAVPFRLALARRPLRWGGPTETRPASDSEPQRANSGARRDAQAPLRVPPAVRTGRS